MGITWSDLSISSTSKGNGKKPDITGPGKTLCQTRTIAMIEDQDQTSLRHGQCIQTRLQSDAIPLSVLRALRPIIDPPAPCTLRDMEMFIHDFRVEWLLLQTEDFKKYFAESEELRTSGKSGESSRAKRMYTDLFILFGALERGTTQEFYNHTMSKARLAGWLLRQSQADSHVVKGIVPNPPAPADLLGNILGQVNSIACQARGGPSRITTIK